ncbi:uncharacterized protein AMSG_09248 [Thecamonas trahens ATCC 50062]|uniref:C2 domain-containing protein n=1 Tax=Thecamonas trahens ATCC 50062 TaxID=461836 RepID=A0A0L0DLF3_THETB|nr:hypothetical protein AMSG_09248 [Thecamonas trahens ATCC 50062]KNC53169.1 hypothetical protein AMSG_09248 [Thecamonas trahens ATCC 50062]|eukprot:XP_013754642.1 hypothetical protein AMSG_09248 [Thecamonas trahens ATCC 50062]
MASSSKAAIISHDNLQIGDVSIFVSNAKLAVMKEGVYRVRIQMFKLKLGKSVNSPPAEGRVYFDETHMSENSEKTMLPKWNQRMTFSVTAINRWLEISIERVGKLSNKIVGTVAVSLRDALANHSSNGIVAEYTDLPITADGIEEGSIHLTLKYTCYYERERKALLGVRSGSYGYKVFTFEAAVDVAMHGHTTVVDAATKWMTAMGSSIEPLSLDTVALPSATKDAVASRATVAYRVLECSQDVIVSELRSSGSRRSNKRPSLSGASASLASASPPKRKKLL